MNEQQRQRLWDRLKTETEYDCGRTVRLAKIACDEMPVHKEEVVNTIQHWRNRGLVESYHGDTRVILTDKGKETDQL
jgi:Mn-dependent DtxR family transcriptional regulator